MQLVAYGAQDVYLTGNPQITFFKVVYRRHTNFSMESIQQTFSGSTKLGQKVSCTISRNGDLIGPMFVEADFSYSPGIFNDYIHDPMTGNAYTSTIENIDVGNLLIKEVSIEIGGQQIDKHYSQWLDIWSELTVNKSKKNGYNIMTNTKHINQNIIGTMANDFDEYQISTKLYIPLQFWFCRNPGLTLPLIALQYHEVKINIEFENKSKIIGNEYLQYFPYHEFEYYTNRPSKSIQIIDDLNASLWVDYYYLDTEERRRFAQVSHEYLIEQIQFTGVESSSNLKHRLNFNHPVKELIWVEQPVINKLNSINPLSNSLNPLFTYNTCKKAKLQLNGHDRFTERNGSYFTLVQPYQHHTNVPINKVHSYYFGSGNEDYNMKTYSINKSIHVYSFGLNPESHQPSGTCNFSRIDNATLHITPNETTSEIYIYAINYNVLRIMGGMAGLAYSN